MRPFFLSEVSLDSLDADDAAEPYGVIVKFCLKMNASAHRYKTRYMSFAQRREGNPKFRGSATALPKSTMRFVKSTMRFVKS